MEKEQQRWLVDGLKLLTERLQKEPGFIENSDLRSAYMILHCAAAAIMFESAHGLAQVCADWCGETAEQSVQNN